MARNSLKSLAVSSLPLRPADPPFVELFRKPIEVDLPYRFVRSPKAKKLHSFRDTDGLRRELKNHESAIMPYEYRCDGKDEKRQEQEIRYLRESIKDFPDEFDGSFHRFNAPLSLLLGAWDLRDRDKVEALYIAQMAIDDLPLGMKDLFQKPTDIIGPDKDIYGSSIWIGIPPTYTPLHKDPNPNMFTQYMSYKKVRLFRPEIGTALFHSVQNALGTNSSAAFRGEEMMQGPEYDAMRNIVWGENSVELEHFDTELLPGQSLFIPKGWWHSIISVTGLLNISANWWFR